MSKALIIVTIIVAMGGLGAVIWYLGAYLRVQYLKKIFREGASFCKRCGETIDGAAQSSSLLKGSFHIECIRLEYSQTEFITMYRNMDEEPPAPPEYRGGFTPRGRSRVPPPPPDWDELPAAWSEPTNTANRKIKWN